METIHRWPKDKEIPFEDVKLTVIDKVKSNIPSNANVTLTTEYNLKGTVP